ncbi:hypothetical protein [Sphingobacterium griseoflavum]|uniref:FAD dependent oxidoreductase domain-containing protein n=1 Tax=Sphingobacterium griseoflavum TaxID=1474952 RepID=A0ABQ3HZ47_9SPHI|nr:hypothetical protein [Sphingobacterium griseoflavum]GHE37677.1 hypothetical protein GCM10017764_21250 [Sphingobacterium griseoflavum]
MKYAYALLLLVLVSAQQSVAQKIKKPQVLVYGSDIMAYTAAIQSALSGVPTLWVADTDTLVPEFSRHAVRIDEPQGLDGGIWLHVLMDMALSKSPNDSLAQSVKENMNPRLFLNAIERDLAKHKDLLVLRGQRVDALKPDGKNWQVVLANKQRFQVRAVLDLSDGQQLAAMLPTETISRTLDTVGTQHLSLQTVRTLVLSGSVGQSAVAITLPQLLQTEYEGFFSKKSLQPLVAGASKNVGLCAALGQAMGAAAAYVAFFKTSTDKIDVRKLQTELMTYGMRIISYQDIPIDDAHFYAIQRFGLSGIILPEYRDGRLFFGKDERIGFGHIQPIFHRLFSRSQLWFADHKGDYLTWNDLLSLLRFVGLRGEEVDRQIEKEWSTKLGFTGVFDRSAYVTRYQFAVVLDLYASPYVKAVTQEGIFIH